MAAACAGFGASGAAWTHQRVEPAAAIGCVEGFFAGREGDELAIPRVCFTCIDRERSLRARTA